jgi:Ring finger domain
MNTVPNDDVSDQRVINILHQFFENDDDDELETNFNYNNGHYINDENDNGGDTMQVELNMEQNVAEQLVNGMPAYLIQLFVSIFRSDPNVLIMPPTPQEYEVVTDDDEVDTNVSKTCYVSNESTRIETPIINEECYICFDSLNENLKQVAQIDDCRHGYCFECLQNWIKKRLGCPVCRCKVTKINLIK